MFWDLTKCSSRKLALFHKPLAHLAFCCILADLVSSLFYTYKSFGLKNFEKAEDKLDCKTVHRKDEIGETLRCLKVKLGIIGAKAFFKILKEFKAEGFYVSSPEPKTIPLSRCWKGGRKRSWILKNSKIMENFISGRKMVNIWIKETIDIWIFGGKVLIMFSISSNTNSIYIIVLLLRVTIRSLLQNHTFMRLKPQTSLFNPYFLFLEYILLLL